MGLKKRSNDPKINKEPVIEYPVFCFKYLQITSFEKCRDAKFFIDFIQRLNKIAQYSWREIELLPKHGFGYEMLPKSKFKFSKFPEIVTDEVSKLMVFRANGKKLPFAGVKINNIMHVIYIETTFGDIYNH
jgi:hypothetical protein